MAGSHQGIADQARLVAIVILAEIPLITAGAI